MTNFLLNMILGTLMAPLRAWPQQRINGFLTRFGKAFGPPGLRHFSELSLAEQQELLARVPVLRTTHDDFLKPFQWIPRTVTTWTGPAPTYADILLGNVSGEPTAVLKPIPNPGDWWGIRGGMSSTSIENWHDRIGWRWDDSDSYWSLSASVKLR